MSKLKSFGGIAVCLDTLPLELDIPDFPEREVMEFAKRAVLTALGGCRIVDIVWDENAAGVDVTGLEALERSMSSMESVSSVCGSRDSSNAGKEGREGISCPSMSSIRLQTREGVSSIVFIFLTCGTSNGKSCHSPANLLVTHVVSQSQVSLRLRSFSAAKIC